MLTPSTPTLSNGVTLRTSTLLRLLQTEGSGVGIGVPGRYLNILQQSNR